MPYIGQGLTEGRRRVETFIATASQTTFNIIYDAGYIDVYQNGILLSEADYTATNGSQVVLAVGAALNDEITIIAHQLFSVTDTVSAAQGGTFTGAITASGGVVGNVTGTVSNISNHLLDEDNMASNDATKVPSQQSVKAYVDTEVAGLVDSAPSTLDTLNELAAALGDDANFSTTITNSIATKLPLAGGTLTGNLTMENTDAGSAAGPEFTLFRNSASAADADYLGQIKFDGKNDAGQSIVYAKITGKILDAADGTEDGIIEIAHKKAGSNNISARFRSDSLQLINGTNLTVAGTTELTGDLTVDTNTLHVDTSNNRVGIGTLSPSQILHLSSGTSRVRIQSTAADEASINFDTPNGQTYIGGTGANGEIISSSSAGDFVLSHRTGGKIHLSADGAFADAHLTIIETGNVGIGNTSPENALHIASADSAQLLVQNTSTGDAAIKFNRSGQTFFMGIESSDNSFRISDTGTGVGDGDRLIIDTSGNPTFTGTAHTSLQVRSADLSTVAFMQTVQGTDIRMGGSTNHPVDLYTNGTRKVRIDSVGRLLVGTDTSSVYYNSTTQYAGDVVIDMNIANNVTDLVLINSNNSFGSTVDFATNNSAGNPVRHGLIGAVPENTTAGSESGRLIFSTKSTTDNNIVERMRITPSGSLLVAKTAEEGNNVGAELRSNGSIIATVDNTLPMFINRKSSGAELIRFAFDNVTIGNIGSKLANSQYRLYLGNSNTKILFDNGADRIYPVNNDGDARNGAIDLGLQGAAFKDLYLTGGIQFDSRSNKLDDYEEGTWVPALGGTGGAPTVSFSSQLGWYRKVGGVVHFIIDVSISSISGGSGGAAFTGLPFTSANYANGSYGMIGMRYGASNAIVYTKRIYGHSHFVNSSDTTLYLYGATSTGTESQIQVSEVSTGRIYIYGTYFAA